jgi:hypothetical protein
MKKVTEKPADNPSNTAHTLFAQPAELLPVEVIRTETVISKLPIHQLAKQRETEIKIERRGEDGKTKLLWEIYPSKAGHPGQLAYKLDSLIVQQRIDEAGGELPKRLRLGSLKEICEQLGTTVSGKSREDIKRALLQNAGCFIKAHLNYVGADSVEYTLTAYFNRYNVIFTGEQFPTGETADAVYLTFSDEYYSVLQRAKRRPLDYGYMKELSASPASQRFYEILSYQMYAALKGGQERAQLSYSDYITYSAQARQTEDRAMTSQMWKVHQPHLRSGYITDVKYTKAVDADGRPDWLISYGIGQKAIAEFEAFNSGGNAAKLPKESRQLTGREAPQPAAAALVGHFLELRYHGRHREAARNELKAAQQLIGQYGEECAHFVVAYGVKRAAQDNYDVKFLHGLAGYFSEAIELYQRRQNEARLAQTETPEAPSAQEQAWELAERQYQALSVEELAAYHKQIEASLLQRVGDEKYSLWTEEAKAEAIRISVIRMLLAQQGSEPDV